MKKQQTETTKRLKQVGEVGQQTAAQFNRLKNEVLAVFGALATAAGIEKFIKDVTTTEVGLGRLSRAIGDMSVTQLDQFGRASARMGGDAKAAQQSILGLSEAIEGLRADPGSNPELLRAFRTMGVMISDPVTKQAVPTPQIIDKMHEWFAAHAGKQAQFMGGQTHLDQGLTDLLSSPNFDEHMAAAAQHGLTGPKDVAAAGDLTKRMADLDQTLTHLGQVVLRDLEPQIGKVLKDMTDWIESNPKLAETVETNIKKAIEVIKSFLSAVNEVVTAVGGWERATEIVFGLWALAKLQPIIDGIGVLTKAMIGLKAETAAVGSAFGVLPGAISLAAGAATILLSGDTPGGGDTQPKLGAAEMDARIQKYNLAHPDNPIESFSSMVSRLWHGATGFFGSHFGGASDERLASVRDQLSQRLGISQNAASGLASNLNAESGIAGINEVNPTSGRGGFGWSQWTDTQGSPRRSNFEGYAASHHLDPASDEANMGFLVEELTTKYPQILAQLRRGDISATEAANIVARGYIVPPSDKIAGHIAGAENIARLKTGQTGAGSDYSGGMVVGPWGARVAGYDPAFSNFMRNPPAAASTSNDNSRSIDQRSEVHVGHISISGVKDADTAARSIGSSLRKYAYANTFNTGLG